MKLNSADMQYNNDLWAEGNKRLKRKYVIKENNSLISFEELTNDLPLHSSY